MPITSAIHGSGGSLCVFFLCFGQFVQTLYADVYKN